MMFLGIGIIRTEKCWPNSPTYSTDVGVLRGWGRAQITVVILGREAKKFEKHCSKCFSLFIWVNGGKRPIKAKSSIKCVLVSSYTWLHAFVG